MNLLLAVVLLAVVQSPASTQKHTPNSTTEEQSSTASQQTQPNTDTVRPSPETQNLGDKQQSVRVTDFPPLSVPKSWTDYTYWFFSLCLVVVGGLQIWLLNETLKTINRQADIAENQKTLMAQAGEQTERIIAQMKETTVRELRAYIGVSKVYLSLEVPTIPRGIVEVENFGRTPAYKVKQWIGIALNPYPPTSEFPESTHTQASVSIISPGVKNTSLVALKKHLPPGVTVGTPEITVYVFGEITYEDAFKQERKTAYRFIYGGPEGGKSFRNTNGVLLGTMNPDRTGNDAD